MRFSASLTIVLLAFGAAVADDDAARSAADNTATDKETIRFDGQPLVLAYEGEADGDAIQEFIPADENLDSWTRLAAVRVHAKLNDPKAFADEMVRQLEAKEPPAPYEVMVNDKTGDVILDFIVSPADQSFVEFNIFKYQKNDDGGLRSEQYALRAYGDDIEKFLQGMDTERRTQLLAEMISTGVQPSEDEE